MLDTKALHQLVEQQVRQEVSDHVATALNEQWIQSVEDNAVGFIQDRIVAKFANSEAMPELIDAVKTSVRELFHSGQIPGLGQYVDYDFIKQSVNDKTQELVQSAINELSVDKTWLAKIETLVNQQMTQRVVATLGSIDIQSVVKQRVEEITESIIKKTIPGIQDQSYKVELSLLDDTVVVEQTLVAKNIEAVESLVVNDLVVKGSVNTDNQSWQGLVNDISQKTLTQLSTSWKQTLVQQVADEIKTQGIDFNNVTIDGLQVISGNKLNNAVTESNLEKLGKLRNITVAGNAVLTDTVNVIPGRMGVNTDSPDMALSVWDEEVTMSLGKYKQNTAYLGTSRKQALAIGINKNPAIEIDDEGITAIKKLQVGIHRVSHGNEVPNYAGTKGDIVFNAVPNLDDNVFAWQCLGGFKWKVIRAVQ